ncbi:NYN domain-containing protein [Paraeggerthella hongkongensis]|uniref:NYN domain-containing protein n=1 Tax=Paraeggerthella hominis TaxID=2897351 RepID=UPI001C10052B|nr:MULTISPECIES: NYN domain-containing protein [Paraeggerthella]MBU5405119.1 NYN domain-containing protein [Paraeggerthella hongkongensis]MCD2432789.1 NYN domain-containing protein [Paraeggerthella hominis]
MARQRKKLLIVDGYNVLRSGSRYRQVTDPDYTDDTFNVARETLINDVINYAGRDWRAIIVFDGARNAFSTGEAETVGGVRIMFSPAGQSADKVIEKLAHDARERQVETLVVTSDATIQDTVFGFGVDRMSADGFSREVGIHYEDARLDETPKVAQKNTVASRIDPAVLAKLKAMRDGESESHGR